MELPPFDRPPRPFAGMDADELRAASADLKVSIADAASGRRPERADAAPTRGGGDLPGG